MGRRAELREEYRQPFDDIAADTTVLTDSTGNPMLDRSGNPVTAAGVARATFDQFSASSLSSVASIPGGAQAIRNIRAGYQASDLASVTAPDLDRTALVAIMRDQMPQMMSAVVNAVSGVEETTPQQPENSLGLSPETAAAAQAAGTTITNSTGGGPPAGKFSEAALLR